MAATIHNSPRAVEMSVFVVRAFVRRSEAAGRHAELSARLVALERKVAGHDQGIREVTMTRKDPRIDAYIAKSAPFARPILKHLRQVVHAGCPQVEETLKWGFPHFLHGGILCSMASFKAHCAFGFWKPARLAAAGVRLPAATEKAMGQFGRLTTLADLPSEAALRRLVKAMAALNAAGVKAPAKPRPAARRAVAVPADLLAALRKNRRALATFEGLSPSDRRDYVEWVTEAKREETRRRRLATAVEWLAEGKVLNWKYVRK